MRLDHALGHRAQTWHCRELRVVKGCRWADDQTNQYAVIDGIDRAACRVIERVVQAERIVIRPGLVLIDPLDDENERPQELCEAIAR